MPLPPPQVGQRDSAMRQMRALLVSVMVDEHGCRHLRIAFVRQSCCIARCARPHACLPCAGYVVCRASLQRPRLTHRAARLPRPPPQTQIAHAQRRYPDFADMRAALAAALWAAGKEGDAETAFSRVDDARCACGEGGAVGGWLPGSSSAGP